MGTPHAHRIQVAFTDAQHSDLTERSRRSGQSLGATVRQLVAAGLRFDAEPAKPADSPAALAALVAAEQAVLMVAAVLPDGRRLMRDLAPEAAAAAEARLAMFQEAEQ